MKNGFNGLLAVVRDAAKGTQKQMVATGVVRSVNPLTVEAEGVLLTGGDLLINSQLLSQSDAQEAVLAVGCRVALITADRDKFVLVCKVVGV